MKSKPQEEIEVILSMGTRIKELERQVNDLKDKLYTLSTDKEYDV